MALKLDNALLDELGLGSLPEAEKQQLLRQIYEKLEMNVGMRLADQMSNEQLDAFEKFVDANDDKGAFQWLESNFPNYKDVVNEEFEKLKVEIKQYAPQMLAVAAQNAQQPPAAMQPGQPMPGQPMAGQQPPHYRPQQPMPGQYQGQQGQPQPQYGAQQPYQPRPQPAYGQNPGQFAAPGQTQSQAYYGQPAPAQQQPAYQSPAGPQPAQPFAGQPQYAQPQSPPQSNAGPQPDYQQPQSSAAQPGQSQTSAQTPPPPTP